MKKFIETLKNIWSIQELRERILLTLGLVLIYRLGTYIALPGLDPNGIAEVNKQGGSGILGLVNIFAGGAFSRASNFCIGYYALYLCFYCHSIVDYGCSISKRCKKRERVEDVS